MVLKYADCATAELVYISDMDYSITLESIGELVKSNFVDQNEMGKYFITEFSLIYLKSKLEFNDSDSIRITDRINYLKGKLENLMSDKHLLDKNRPLSFFPSDR